VARLGRPGGLSAAGKKELWKRWRAGESISDIARALQKPPGSIHGMLEVTGGISPAERHRRRCALTPSEREEISRGSLPENPFVRSPLGWAAVPPRCVER
jgi:transposase, IS30 family